MLAAGQVQAVLASRDSGEVDVLFRRLLAEFVPAGTAQPRWIAEPARLVGVFEGYGAVRDFADWCDATGADPGFEFGPPPEVVLYSQHLVAGHVVHVECVADQHDVDPWFRLNPNGL
jgi:hypothetical protein